MRIKTFSVEGPKSLNNYLHVFLVNVSAEQFSAHHLSEEADHNVRVYEGRVVSDEGLGDVGHDAGVVPGEALGSVHLHTETSPRSLRGKPLWDHQVPDRNSNKSLEMKRLIKSVTHFSTSILFGRQVPKVKHFLS